MAKVSLKTGTTSYLARIFIQDSSSTTGAGLAGLTNASSGLVCYRARDDDGNAGGTAISLASATLGTWTSAGFKEKDATNMPGVYEFGVPNAAIASGSKAALIMFKGATNMAPLVLEIELTAVDNQDGVRFGLTALPNAAAEASGGLYTRGAGAGQINQDANGRIDANAKALLGTVISTPATAGIMDVNLKNIANAAVSASTAQLGVNAVNLGGTAQTGRDLGASVLLTAAESGIIQSGTAAAGAGSTITIATALGADSLPNGCIIKITSGTGIGQSRVITGYVNSTKVVTVGHAWTTNPDNTSVYAIMFADSPKVDSSLKVAGVVLADTLTTYTGNTPQTGDSYPRLGAPAGASVSADIAAVKVDTAAVKVQTDKLAFTVTNQIDANVLDWKSATAPAMTGDAFARLGAPAGASVSADVAAVKAVDDAIKAKTDNLPASPASTTNITAGTITTVSGNVNGSVASVTAAVSLSAGDSPVLQSGTAAAGTSTTITLASAIGADSRPVGCIIKITSGTGSGQARGIITYVDATKVVTVDRAWATNPDNTSVYSVLFDEAAKLDSNLKIAGVVLADTVTTYTGNTVQTGDAYARLGAPAGASTAADIAGVQTDTTNIKTRLPAALTSNGNMKSSILEWISTAFSEGAVGRMAAAIQQFFNIASPTSTMNLVTTVTNLTNAPTAGDLTATMKTSVTIAATAATPTIAGYTGNTPQTGDAFARLGAPVGASISADVAGVQADTDNIQTRLPAALVSGRMDSSVGAMTTGAAVSVWDVAESAVLTAASMGLKVKNTLPQRITKNTALSAFPFVMVLSSDHISAGTGLTVTATRSIDGAAFGACANSVTEVGSGVYVINLAATDLNGTTIVLKFAAATADTREIVIITEPAAA